MMGHGLAVGTESTEKVDRWLRCESLKAWATWETVKDDFRILNLGD